MLEQRLHASHGPRVATPQLRLNDQPIVVERRPARQATGLILGKFGLDVFFGGRLQDQLVRQPVSQDQVEREPHSRHRFGIRSRRSNDRLIRRPRPLPRRSQLAHPLLNSFYSRHIWTRSELPHGFGTIEQIHVERRCGCRARSAVRRQRRCLMDASRNRPHHQYQTTSSIEADAKPPRALAEGGLAAFEDVADLRIAAFSSPPAT